MVKGHFMSYKVLPLLLSYRLTKDKVIIVWWNHGNYMFPVKSQSSSFTVDILSDIASVI